MVVFPAPERPVNQTVQPRKPFLPWRPPPSNWPRLSLMRGNIEKK